MYPYQGLYIAALSVLAEIGNPDVRQQMDTLWKGQTVVYPYSGILHSSNMGQTPNSCSNTGDSRKRMC